MKVLIALVIVAVLIGLAYETASPRPGLTKFEAGLRDFLTPLQSGVNSIRHGTQTMITNLVAYHQLKEENEALKAQIRSLTLTNDRFNEHFFENNRLRRLLQFQETEKNQYITKAAQVIGRNPTNWYRTLTINRGSEDGIRKDNVAITDQGLVGRVVAVTRRSAEVSLILDHEGAVGALIQESRLPGVVEGCEGWAASTVQLIHLPPNVLVKPNEVVITSGLGGIFPKGLKIGSISEVMLEPDGLMQKALVKPFVDFDRLEEMLIITGVRGSY